MKRYNLLYNSLERATRMSAGRQIIVILAVTTIALLLRLLWFPFESLDYEIFLQPWFEEIKANGGFMAIGHPIGDYLPSYIYILAALSYLPINSLVCDKLFTSFILDGLPVIF